MCILERNQPSLREEAENCGDAVVRHELILLTETTVEATNENYNVKPFIMTFENLLFSSHNHEVRVHFSFQSDYHGNKHSSLRCSKCSSLTLKKKLFIYGTKLEMQV